jgi:hypothetical protein
LAFWFSKRLGIQVLISPGDMHFGRTTGSTILASCKKARDDRFFPKSPNHKVACLGWAAIFFACCGS